MATLIVEAIYQKGVIKPLALLDLEENAHLLISIEAVKPADLSLAADDPCGAFPELDFSYETIEAITHSSWESKINALAHSLTEDEY